MATPHIQAEKEDLADIVLLPGDPLRAKLIAKTYLTDSILINEVRGMLGYTGLYKGKKVSVLSSGMGNPSMGIYSYELFSFYGVQTILRIGSAGSYTPDLKLGEILLVKDSWSDSSYAQTQTGCTSPVLFSSDVINQKIIQAARKNNYILKTVRAHCTDVFYRPGDPDYYQYIRDTYNCACVEMESFALFQNAHIMNRHAACLLTVSDSFPTGEKMSAKERQESFHTMIVTALESTLEV